MAERARVPIRVLPVVDRVAADVHLDPYLTLTALAAYAGVSVRQLREYLVNPPLPRDAGAPLPPPLPHYRLAGRILVRRSEFDRWMAAYIARPSEARALAHALHAQTP
jgi:hypothetical protein